MKDAPMATGNAIRFQRISTDIDCLQHSVKPQKSHPAFHQTLVEHGSASTEPPAPPG